MQTYVLALFVEQKSMKLQPVYISIDNNYMIHNTPHIPILQLKSAKCPILDRL